MAQNCARVCASSSVGHKEGVVGKLQTADLSCNSFGVSFENKNKQRQGGQQVHHRGPALNARAGKKQVNGGTFQSQAVGSSERSSTRRQDVKLQAERVSTETTATENSKATSQTNGATEDKFTKAKPSVDGNVTKGPSTRRVIALEAATHFNQFEKVLQVLEGHESAVNAEIGHNQGAKLFEGGAWSVLLGLADRPAGRTTRGSKMFEAQLMEIQAERAAKDASWAVEKAEMEAKLEEMSREATSLEALLRELQQEALGTTQTAGPWQGEDADGEERAWWQPAQMIAGPASSSASTIPHSLHQPESHSLHSPRNSPSLSAPGTTHPRFLPLSPHSHPHTSDARLRETEQPSLLAAEESLTRRLSTLRSQVARAQGAPQNPFQTLGVRALESLREGRRGGAEALGSLTESVRSLGERALPIVRKGAREGRWIVAAVVVSAAAAAAGVGVRRVYQHHREVRIAAAQLAAEEQLRQMQGTVVDLNVDNFVPVLTTRPTIVKFYTDWCPYCKRMAPTWEELAKRISEKGLNVQVARLNADVYSEPVMDLNLKGFPSLVLFEGTKPILNYTGPRDIDALLGVVEETYRQAS